MVDTIKHLSPEIQTAIDEMKFYPSVTDICEIVSEEQFVIVKVMWAVNLPNAFLKKGISGTGVNNSEPVYWKIPVNYPLKAPSPRLRTDFPLNLPHINPHTQDERVYPCIAEMALEDLLHSSGLRTILDAMSQWLNNAAANELHCPVQGWEHMRRDTTSGMIVVDTHSIREELCSVNKPARFYEYRYFYWKDIDGPIWGSLSTPHLGSKNNSYKEKYVGIDANSTIRNAPGILFQTNTVIDQYRPEMVIDFNSLREFATFLGLKEVFNTRLKAILPILGPKHTRKQQKIPVEEFMIAFAIERPFNLIGINSSWEILAYRIRYTLNENKQIPDNSSVVPTQFLERCCSQLLQSVSGKKARKPVNIGFLGCGSLGSKIALHFAKSGYYQFELVDKDYFSSHNNARHALIISDFDTLYGSKSDLLHREISKLNIKSKAINEDIRYLGKKDGFSLNKKTDYIIDSTASLPVRYFLAHECNSLPGLLIHTVLYGKATLGVVAIEGVNRQVRVDDLMAFTNALCITNNSVQDAMYGDGGPEQNYYGEGCRSVSTTMNDIDISLMSSAITSKINDHVMQDKKNESGVLNVGVIDKQSLNMNWEEFQFSPTLVIPRDKKFNWDIRVLGTVVNEIKQISDDDKNRENGGVIAGQICHLSNTIYITYLIEAPEGSQHTSNNFELSTNGLAQKFERIHHKTNGQITFLGTWHSHTRPVPPSIKDRNTLSKLQINYDLPIVMLTYTGGRIVRV